MDVFFPNTLQHLHGPCTGKDVGEVLGQKVLGCSRCNFQTARRHLLEFCLKVFLRIVGIVEVAETFRELPFLLLGNDHVPETADIQPNLVG